MRIRQFPCDSHSVVSPPCCPLTSRSVDSLHPATHLGTELLVPHVTVAAVPAAQKTHANPPNRYNHDAEAELAELAVKLAVLAGLVELA